MLLRLRLLLPPPPLLTRRRSARATHTVPEPCVKMLCHKGSVAAIAIDRGGRYMATSGRDGQLKLWDIRTYKPLHEYRTPRIATSIDVCYGQSKTGHQKGRCRRCSCLVQ